MQFILKTILTLGLRGVYIFSLIVSATSVAWADQSNSKTQAQLDEEFDADVSAAHQLARYKHVKKLEVSDVLDDGARGYYFEEFPPREIFQAPDIFSTVPEMVLNRRLCNSTEVVVAMEKNSDAKKTKDGNAVYTRSVFEVTDVIKSESGLAVAV